MLCQGRFSQPQCAKAAGPTSLFLLLCCWGCLRAHLLDLQPLLEYGPALLFSGGLKYEWVGGTACSTSGFSAIIFSFASMALIFALTLKLDCVGSVLDEGSRLIGRIFSLLWLSYRLICACAHRTTNFLESASFPFKQCIACSASCFVSKFTKQYPRGCPSNGPDLWNRKSNCFTLPNF